MPDIEHAMRELKRWQPWTIDVHTADGEKKTVKIPEKRTKWESVKATLKSFNWVRIEAHNKRKELLGTVSDEDGGMGLFTEVDLGGVSSIPKVVAVLLSLVIKAQDMALKRDRERMEMVMSHQTKLVESVVGKFANMQRTQMAHLEMISDLMIKTAGDDDSTSGAYVGTGIKALLALHNPEAAKAAFGGDGDGSQG